MKTALEEGWFRLRRGETVHFFPRDETSPLCGMIDRIWVGGNNPVIESVNEDARCLHCRHSLGTYEKKLWNDMDRVHGMAARAQQRSRVEMLKESHRLMVFDAGMSFYCKVCGNRQQSLQPSPTFDHRKECPGDAIQAEIMEAGGWE
jgi:hypothetical protein